MAARSSAAARRRPTPRARGKQASPRVQQHHLDLLALALVALAVLMAFVAWLQWDGGAAGRALLDGTRWLVGSMYVALPVVLMGAAALIVLRPALPAGKPLRLGGVLLFLGMALALRDGGVVGDGLERGTTAALGAAGPGIVAVFLLAAAALLLTGASVASILTATGSRVSSTSRRVRETTAEARTAVTRLRPARLEAPEPPAARNRKAPPAAAPAAPAGEDAEDPFAGEDPEADAFAAVVEAAEPEAPAPGRDGFWSGSERFPDFFGGAAPDAREPEPEEAAPVEAMAYDLPEPVDAPLEPDPDPSPEPEPVTDAPRLAEDPETDEPGVLRSTADVDPADLTPQGRYRPSVTDDPGFEWLVPDPRVLKRSAGDADRPDTRDQEKVAGQLLEALGHFGIQARIVGMVAGPHITRYELRLAPGIKVAKVAQLKDDLAYALAASDIRILAPIPGKQAVGVEVPNARRRIVHLGDVLQDGPPDWSPLTVWLGKDVAGRAIGADLAKMPHLLVAGTTGAGKSGCINAMLSSVLLRATPHEVRMVLVDPKQVELTHYDSIPHLLTPVITSPRKAATALQNLVREMEQRYTYMALARTRNLPEMNRVRESRGEAALPYVLCVIDELADLMMVAPADVEDSIIRLAQKARAVGIHLVLATQSPRVDVITGMIKANVPSRIAFAVSSQTDSRVILDQNGAESLLGQGDMLFAPVGSSRLQRIQGAYIDEAEIEKLTEVWRRQGEPEFREELLEEVEEAPEETAGADDGFDPDEDPLLEDAIRLVAEMQTASTSMLQRRLRLGYTRAGRLIDMLERRGVISGYEGSKPRQVLVTEGDVPRVLAALGERAGAGAAPVAVAEDPEPPPPPDEAL